MREKPRLLILSAVYPFPRDSGQQQRVYYKLRALRLDFHLTFLTIAERSEVDEVRQKLLELCDEAIVLPSAYTRNSRTKLFHRALGSLYALITGLKFSNYLIGEVEFSRRRLIRELRDMAFDAVVFEYWHAFRAARLFQQRGSRTILDMHDVLWRSYARQLDARAYLPGWLKQWSVRRYQAREESAWKHFDLLIAINRDEYDYARLSLPETIKTLYAPMGTDISLWPYGWQPCFPRRVAYYGGLGSPHNQQDALSCYREVLPAIWERCPDVKFWIVGSNPPASIKELESDPRVRVTGYLSQPQDVLKTMSLVLCPWSGTYGFRSRLIEVMALGVPVIASRDAVQGMELKIGAGILIAGDGSKMAALSLDLLQDVSALKQQSTSARRQVEEKFSYEATYARLSDELAEYLV
jgi:glycosyltransferase involved in cell wall biosynthesis